MNVIRIILVEDDPLVSGQLEAYLTSLGYDVLAVFTSGEETIERVRMLAPDLIIMDIELSGKLDGIETAASIKKLSNIPVIFATAHSNESFFNRAEVTEPFGYLIKPVKERELELTIRIALYHSQLENQLIKSEQHLIDAQRIGLLGSWDWDITNDTLKWSDQMFRIFGQEPQSIIANYQAFIRLVHPDDREHIQMAIDSALTGKKHFCKTYRVITSEGNINRIQAEGEVTFDEQGNATRMIGTAHDITAVLQLQDELWLLAHHDELTNIPNRNLLYDRIGQSITRAKREKKQFAILLLDLDNFKNVNDYYGHHVGDEYLKNISSRLLHSLRDDDTLARLGGDEFEAVLNDIKSGSDVITISNKLLDSIGQTLTLGDATLNPTTSIGIAIYPKHGTDKDSLLKAADAAMYQSKHQGKNTCCIFK